MSSNEPDENNHGTLYPSIIDTIVATFCAFGKPEVTDSDDEVVDSIEPSRSGRSALGGVSFFARERLRSRSTTATNMV